MGQYVGPCRPHSKFESRRSDFKGKISQGENNTKLFYTRLDTQPPKEGSELFRRPDTPDSVQRLLCLNSVPLPIDGPLEPRIYPPVSTNSVTEFYSAYTLRPDYRRWDGGRVSKSPRHLSLICIFKKHLTNCSKFIYCYNNQEKSSFTLVWIDGKRELSPRRTFPLGQGILQTKLPRSCAVSYSADIGKTSSLMLSLKV